jgi:hypothetical protein
MKKIPFLVVSLASLLWVGCSEPPPAPVAKEPAKPPAAVTGASGLFQMYQVARAKFSTDAQVLKLNSIRVPEVPAAPGKAGAWQATFVSASLGKSRTYTYSVVEEGDNLHKGVFPTGDGDWSGRSGVNTAFELRDVMVDSDAAYKTALEKAGDYDPKHPGTPISFLLERTNRYPVPAWRVIWGESIGTSSYSIYVDAVQGHFLEKMH